MAKDWNDGSGPHQEVLRFRRLSSPYNFINLSGCFSVLLVSKDLYALGILKKSFFFSFIIVMCIERGNFDSRNEITFLWSEKIFSYAKYIWSYLSYRSVQPLKFFSKKFKIQTLNY